MVRIRTRSGDYSPMPGGLCFCQAECRADELLHHGHDFLKVASGASEGIETLEADQGVEDIDRLIEGRRGWPSILLNEPPDNDTKAPSPPFVSCPHHLLEVRIECSQSPESTSHEPVGVPEATEDRDVLGQRVKGVRAAESGGQLLHPPVCREGIAEGFEQPNFGAELVVDGHASNISLASDGVDGEAGKAITCHEQLTGRCDDTSPCLFRGCLTLTKPVRPWTHRGLDTSQI